MLRIEYRLPEETLEQVQAVTESAGMPVLREPVNVFPFLPGDAVFIRTVTNFFTGRVVNVTPEWIGLEDAAWIANTGRFADFLKTGTATEVEPYPDMVFVMRAAMVDICRWEHELLTVQK